MEQSNSAIGACGITASGGRRDGIATVVDIVGKMPGLDGFCIAWVHAGGEIRNGQLVGMCERMPPGRFAEVLSLQKRVQDAEKTDKIVPCSSKVVVRKRDDGRVIRAKTYKLPGHVPVGVSASRPGHLSSNVSPMTAKPQPKPKPKAAVPPAKASAIVSDLMDFLDD